MKDQLISLAEFQKVESGYIAAREKHGSARAALKLTRSGARAEDIAMAEAEHDEARARLDAVAYEIEKSTLPAPLSGFIVRKHVDVGNWVNAGEPVADLVDLDPVFAAGPVGERRITLLRTGLPATVSLDAFPGEVFSGEVAHIIPQADTRSSQLPGEGPAIQRPRAAEGGNAGPRRRSPWRAVSRASSFPRTPWCGGARTRSFSWCPTGRPRPSRSAPGGATARSWKSPAATSGPASR